MSDAQLTPREREYLECETPLLSGGKAALRLIGGFFASFGKAIVSPTTVYGKSEQKITRTVKEIRYTRYKKAVLRKQNGTPKKGDEKLLKKLNKKDFIFAEDAYDPDEFTKQIYEEYLKRQEELRNRK